MKSLAEPRPATPVEAELLAGNMVALYASECPEILPRNILAFRDHLTEQLIPSIAQTVVIIDEEIGAIVASVSLSTSAHPRRSPWSVTAVLRSVPRFRSGVHRFWYHQARLARLLCQQLPPETAQVHSLYVDPDYRGHGLAKRLMLEAQRIAEMAGDRFIYLYILEGNNVEGIYANLGYERSQIPRRRFIYPAIAMQRATASSIPTAYDPMS